MNWTVLETDLTVPAKPIGLWTLVHDFIEGPALLKIEAEGTWSYAVTQMCGPDGDLNSLIGRNHVIQSGASVGALLVKIGGSTAALDDGTVAVAGSTVVIELDASVSGPVFLTINDEPTGFGDNSGSLKAKLSVLRRAVPGTPSSDAD